MAEELIVRRRGYRIREVAEMLGIDEKTVRRAIASDALEAHRCGTVVLIYPADLDAWIASFERIGGAA
ncbi:MAG: helix-turn-helix domain-containing protein [Mycobacterium sp.]